MRVVFFFSSFFNLTNKDNKVAKKKIIQGHIALFAMYLRYNNAGKSVPRRVRGVSDNEDLQRGERGQNGVCDIFTLPVSSSVK